MNVLRKYISKIDIHVFKVAYKLSYDVLFLSLISFFMAIIAEGVLPGFISAHVGFAKIILFILLLVAATIALGRYLGIEKPLLSARKNVLTPFFLLISFLLIGNTMLKLPLWQNLFITITLVLILFNFFELSFDTEKK